MNHRPNAHLTKVVSTNIKVVGQRNPLVCLCTLYTIQALLAWFMMPHHVFFWTLLTLHWLVLPTILSIWYLLLWRLFWLSFRSNLVWVKLSSMLWTWKWLLLSCWLCCSIIILRLFIILVLGFYFEHMGQWSSLCFPPNKGSVFFFFFFFFFFWWRSVIHLHCWVTKVPERWWIFCTNVFGQKTSTSTAFWKECVVFANIKDSTAIPPGEMQSLPSPPQPFHLWRLDFMSKLPKSHDYNLILIVVYWLTKYVQLMPCWME